MLNIKFVEDCIRFVDRGYEEDGGWRMENGDLFDRDYNETFRCWIHRLIIGMLYIAMS